MASADFSQFVVTTANETACEISPVKVRTLSLHVPAAFTRTSSNFWTSVSFATLSAFPSLICGSCPSGQRFAYSFFQIPPRDGHPCCSAMCFLVVYAHSGLSPVRERPCRANKIGEKAKIPSPRFFPSLLPGQARFQPCNGVKTEAVGFEPTCPGGQTDFESAPL